MKPLEDIAFLARSRHRVEVLEALRESRHSRQALQATVDASRVTVGRVLADMEARGWVRRDGHDYEATPLGELVVEDLAQLCETVTTTRRLRPVVEWFPAEWLSFDLRSLADAEVVVPTRGDPMAPVRRAAALMREAARVSILAEAVLSETLAMQWEAATERGQESTLVMSRETRDTVAADSTMASQLRELIETGLTTAYCYEGDIPASLGVYDGETVGVGLLDDSMRPAAVVLTDDDSVLAWAEETVDTYREAARPLSPNEFEG